jgi:hypothetical protein
MSAANRRRGADAERAVVNYLRSMGWPDARRYLAGDGRQPGDIDFSPGVCLEVKDVASSAWPTWRAQCVAEAGGRIPIVVRRTRGVTDVGAWEAQMLTCDVLDLLGDDMAPLADLVHDRRTGFTWHRTTFADICALLAIEH